MRFGMHIAVGGGLEKGAVHAAEIGCETLQIFSGNPRSWHSRPVAPEAAHGFRKALATHGLSPLVVHAVYLINLAAANPEVAAKSRVAFGELVARCTALQADYLVLHPGAHGDSGADAGIAQLGEALAAALGVPGAPRVLLENTAGAGSTLGRNFGELARIRKAAGAVGAGLGLCFDTCHAWAEGYDVQTEAGWRELLEEARATWGPDGIQLIHANDSKGLRGTHLDRHEHLGAGSIGEAGFRAMMSQPELASLPVILETPMDEDGRDVQNLATLRRLWNETHS